MPDDVWKSKDDIWDQGAADGWVSVHSTYSGSGAITPEGDSDRTLGLSRTKTGDI